MSNLIIKRPENIFKLFSSLLNIDGVGEKKLKLLEKKIGPYIINLLFYLPSLDWFFDNDYLLCDYLKKLILPVLFYF